MYYRLGKFEDVRRSVARAMKWAKDFRMDDHLTQRGENTDNLWYDKGPDKRGSVTLAVDNYAIPAATVRGLFDYDYRADRLILRPRVPGTITQYVQKHPVRFGEKTLYLSCRNGGPKIKSATVSGKAIRVDSPEALALLYDELPKEAQLEIVTEGGWPAGSARRHGGRRHRAPACAAFPGRGTNAPRCPNRSSDRMPCWSPLSGDWPRRRARSTSGRLPARPWPPSRPGGSGPPSTLVRAISGR